MNMVGKIAEVHWHLAIDSASFVAVCMTRVTRKRDFLELINHRRFEHIREPVSFLGFVTSARWF